MKVLVTGAAGYIGSVLVEQLLMEGYDVIGVDNFSYHQPVSFAHLAYRYHKRFKFYQLDVVLDARAMSSLINQCDVVIPLAAMVGMSICDRYPNAAEYTNFHAIQWICQHLTEDQLIVYPNTNSGYGKTVGNELCTEETPMKPISVYGETKCAAEKVVLQHPSSVVFRLATVFGTSPRMRLDLLVNDLTFKAFNREDIVLYEKDAMRNYVHIRDVCGAFVFAIQNRTAMKQQIYNLGHDESNMSKQQLVNTIGEIIPWKNVSYDDTTKDPDQRDYIVSSDKLAKTGFKAMLDIWTGVQELVCLYQTFDYNSSREYMYNK